MNIDKTALFNIGYGLYVVTCKDENKDNALICNTVCQLSDSPLTVAVNLNKANYSTEIINKTKSLNVNILNVSCPFDVFKRFGYVSGKNINKFEESNYLRSENGLIVLDNYINSYMSLTVRSVIELSTHLMFICDVVESKVVNNLETMTYTYYQKNVKPKPVVTKTGWVCKVCGYFFEGDKLPEDFICPTCKHGISDFEKVTIENNEIIKGDKIMKYRCKICGQIVEVKEGENCPICGADFGMLEPITEGVSVDKLEWACKHDIGVANSSIDPFVLQGCRDHFKGECSEVGMYKAMARQALREGYPEIAMLFDKIAEEEAEHAAKFAEMLGEVVVADTKANIEKMLAGENGACKSKLEIAKKAKELNYDAIHDAVHEMAKDEQRHGAALEAMLKRYFGK